MLSAYQKQWIMQLYYTYFRPHWILVFPLLNWAGLWWKFTTAAFCSQYFTLLLLTRRSAGSTVRFSSPPCEAWRHTPGTLFHHSMSCCCHYAQWPCPSLQVNVFTDRYLQFNVDSMCHCACYIEVQTATIYHYRLTDKCYVLTDIIHE